MRGAYAMFRKRTLLSNGQKNCLMFEVNGEWPFDSWSSRPIKSSILPLQPSRGTSVEAQSADRVKSECTFPVSALLDLNRRQPLPCNLLNGHSRRKGDCELASPSDVHHIRRWSIYIYLLCPYYCSCFLKSFYSRLLCWLAQRYVF